VILLALDIGKVCGWSLGDVRSPVPRCGVWPLPVRDKRDVLGARVAALRDTLVVALREWEVEVVAVAEAIRSRNSGEAAYKGGLLGVVREECWRRRVRFIGQPEGTVRKAVLGRGNGPSEVMKELALEWCLSQGIDVALHDAADSAVLWSWCARELGTHPLGGLRRAGRLAVQPELRSR
jgi:Holliday junction resolvasome RuvABC endonuclease subunit